MSDHASICGQASSPSVLVALPNVLLLSLFKRLPIANQPVVGRRCSRSALHGPMRHCQFKGPYFCPLQIKA